MNDLRAIRDGLFSSIDRWAPEIISAPPRSTLRFGIAQKCYAQIDRILEICVDECVMECGPEGMEAAKACAEGKPLARLTLGERVQVLEKLDACLGSKLKGLANLSGSRVLGSKGIKLLHRLSKDRNRFIHDFADVQPEDVTGLLARASELCESHLVEAIGALQLRRASGEKLP